MSRVTEAMTETALITWFKNEVSWDKGMAPWTADQFRQDMKATLEAALSAPPAPAPIEAEAVLQPLEDTDLEDECPVCAEAFKPEDVCATDIELGICHSACLEGSAVVDLNTGEPSDGPIDTYLYRETDAPAPAARMDAEREEGWTYKIQYGPDGEANYAWVYRGKEMVATMQTHSAVLVCTEMNAAALARAALSDGGRDG